MHVTKNHNSIFNGDNDFTCKIHTFYKTFHFDGDIVIKRVYNYSETV